MIQSPGSFIPEEGHRLHDLPGKFQTPGKKTKDTSKDKIPSQKEKIQLPQGERNLKEVAAQHLKESGSKISLADHVEGQQKGRGAVKKEIPPTVPQQPFPPNTTRAAIYNNFKIPAKLNLPEDTLKAVYNLLRDSIVRNYNPASKELDTKKLLTDFKAGLQALVKGEQKLPMLDHDIPRALEIAISIASKR